MDEKDHYRALFAQLNGGVPVWLRRMRERGLSRFLDLGFPTPRQEEWRHTNVGPIADLPFRLADRPAARAVAEIVARARLGVGCELVFLNGHFVGELSSTGSAPAGVVACNLAAAAHTHGDRVAAYLGRCADEDGHSFTALNQAFLHDGAFIWVEPGAQVADAIHVLFLSTEARGTFACPRLLVVAGESARVSLVETYVGRDPGASFTNAVTEIVVGANAAVHHVRIQQESEAAFHVGTVVARQEADSRFTSVSIAVGGALVRTDVEARLVAPGSDCQLDGLYMTQGRQHVDHHTSIDHQQPRCRSRELYKGVLDGQSSAVFNGKVFVRPNAQQSDAQQVNRNLLLSAAAEVNTKPQLEIFADDVKCSHGATIGRLDDDALFYLQARGIDAAAARALLVYGFANELITRIPVAAVHERLDGILRERLRRGVAEEARG